MTATRTIPLMVPYVTDAMRAAVQETMHSRFIGQGPRVDEFERQFSAQIAGGRPCVAVGSCTDALHLAYLLAGIGPDDEVIAPLFTCTATNIPLLYCGATIRFCDVAPDSLNMDAAHCLEMVNERTKAIVVVNYGGASVSDAFFKIGLPVIEDCAQSLASEPGPRGDLACYSFQAVKHVTTADGGMLVLSDGLAEKARRMRWFGIERKAKLAGTWRNDIWEIGYKYQMNDIAATMGLEGLKSLDWQIEYRRALRDAYRSNLTHFDGIQVLDHDPRSACWLMTVLVDRREDLKRKLAAEGIESDQVHYRNDRYTIFKDFRGEFPNMDAIDGKYLCLPLHMGMDVGDVDRICDVIRTGW